MRKPTNKRTARGTLAIVAFLALATALTTPVAMAAPTNANANSVETTCNGQSVTVVVIGSGPFTPAHVLSNTSVFIPTAFDLTLTFTPPGGGTPTVDTQMGAKAAPLENTTTCTIPLQPLFTGPEGETATIEGTVTGFFTPR
jgi:hypothetical protein